MSRRADKELILDLTGLTKETEGLLSAARHAGIARVLVEPAQVAPAKSKGFKILSEGQDADTRVFRSLLELKSSDPSKSGLMIQIKGKKEIETAREAAKMGASLLIFSATDWKVIPLENVIAEMGNRGTRIVTTASSLSEVRTSFEILEKGVHGVLLRSTSASEVEAASKLLKTRGRFDLVEARVVQVKDTGSGERVCVDTASMLKMGEGLLIGSRANFMFLVHNESVGSEFTSPRPFRVNAGSVHSYVLMPDGKTKYLSELEAGDETLIVGHDGSPRTAVVGRVKIERRPMRLIRAEANGERGSILVQNAETIRFVRPDGGVVACTELKEGDRIVTYVVPSKGRHFGMEVDEFILEK